jgi:hypothetical protein
VREDDVSILSQLSQSVSVVDVAAVEVDVNVLAVAVPDVDVWHPWLLWFQLQL